jgi:hypothetical protein
MTTEIAVIASPATSRLIINSLCLKLPTGGLGSGFFCVLGALRGLGLGCGLASSLALARLRGVAGLSIKTGYPVSASYCGHKFRKVKVMKL